MYVSGVMKTWKKRWFVLDYHNAYFAYFESEEVENAPCMYGVVPVSLFAVAFYKE